MDSGIIWKDCLDGIAGHVSETHFATWFKPIRVVGGDDEWLELEVPNHFFLEWVKEHYLGLIHETLRKTSKKEFDLSWKVGPGCMDKPGRKAQVREKESGAPKTQKAALPLLNPRYTFENFVVGKANEFAHAAAWAVTNHLASKYNPLFIYGGVGLGKTHLLQAIGHKALEDNPAAKVCYYTSERFLNEFIGYLNRKKPMYEFRGKFRNVDLLLIDDIQFWSKKEGIQEEFFHTFNVLYESHKQIVVTSDKFPKDLVGIEERLRSRFEWGLVADIHPPDTETKLAILRKKTKAEGIKLPDEVAEWLVSVSGANIRELEGHLNRIIAYSNLTGHDISLAASKDALKNLLKKKEDRFITIEEIQKAVCSYYNVKQSDLKSKRRHKNISHPRQVAMYVAREHGRFSFPEIGSSFGGKDHSTAIHAVKKIEKDIDENAELKHAVRTIKTSLGIG